jgi:hypothetical protein
MYRSHHDVYVYICIYYFRVASCVFLYLVTRYMSEYCIAFHCIQGASLQSLDYCRASHPSFSMEIHSQVPVRDLLPSRYSYCLHMYMHLYFRRSLYEHVDIPTMMYFATLSSRNTTVRDRINDQHDNLLVSPQLHDG